MFAMLTGLLNFSNGFFSSAQGIMYNKIIEIYYTEDDNNLD